MTSKQTMEDTLLNQSRKIPKNFPLSGTIQWFHWRKLLSVILELLKILLALSEGNGEVVAEIAIRMSEKLEGFNAPEFRRRITQLVALRRDLEPVGAAPA